MTYTDEDVERATVSVCNHKRARYDLPPMSQEDLKASEGRHWKLLVDESRCFLAALPRQTVPEGWVCVPKEPTQAMRKAGRPGFATNDPETAARATYIAMLASAPPTQQEGK